MRATILANTLDLESDPKFTSHPNPKPRPNWSGDLETAFIQTLLRFKEGSPKDREELEKDIENVPAGLIDEKKPWSIIKAAYRPWLPVRS